MIKTKRVIKKSKTLKPEAPKAAKVEEPVIPKEVVAPEESQAKKDFREYIKDMRINDPVRYPDREEELLNKLKTL